MDVPYSRYSSLSFDTRSSAGLVDQVPFSGKFGQWTIYNTDRAEKYLHARAGHVDTISRRKPPTWRYYPPFRLIRHGRYSMDAWEAALTTPLERRLAELWVAIRRLSDAGLGPKAHAIILVNHFVRDGRVLGPTVGFRTEDAATLPPKAPATDSDLLAVGVQPDFIRSCVRQQVNGYVIDLCSVRGVVPINAEAEVSALSRTIGRLLHDRVVPLSGRRSPGSR